MEFGVVAGCLVAAYFLFKGANAGRLRILPKSVRIKGGKLYLVVRAMNPTGSQFTIDSAVGDIYLKGAKVGTVSTFSKTVILPNSEQEFEFLVTMNLAGFFSTVKDLIEKRTTIKNFATGLTANMTINVGGTPFDIAFDF